MVEFSQLPPVCQLSPSLFQRLCSKRSSRLQRFTPWNELHPDGFTDCMPRTGRGPTERGRTRSMSKVRLLKSYGFSTVRPDPGNSSIRVPLGILPGHHSLAENAGLNSITYWSPWTSTTRAG